MAKMRWYDLTAYWLITIGAVNWGLDKFLNLNLVDKFGSLSSIIYALVSLAGVYAIWLLLTGTIRKK